MPTTVKAKNGDTLCGFAIEAGFVDCGPLRALADNAGLLSRPLRDGDEVTIPDRTVFEANKGTDARHKFTKRNSPPVAIRFVHGSRELPYRQDATLTELHISNYVTTKAGDDGLQPFPEGYGFNLAAHEDPDTFKVEVVDPLAGGSVTVRLEAMRPIYRDLVKGMLTVDGFVEFAAADAHMRRKTALECKAVGSGTKAFRSAYLRLVTTESDWNERFDQALLVSDLADGQGTGKPDDNDTLEILDQQVRATYVIPRCPGSPKCQVSAQVPVGKDRKRVSIAVHVFRHSVGSNATVGGLTEADMTRNLRRRLFKWFRRVLAQADLSVKLVDPFVEFLDPPAQNTLAIAVNDANLSPAGTTLSFTLRTSTGHTDVRFPVPAGKAPLEVAEALAAALPAAFHGDPRRNSRPFHAARPTADLIVTAKSGARVTITDVRVTPARPAWQVHVARVVLDDVEKKVNSEDSVGGPTPEARAILRSTKVSDTRLDCFVIETFSKDSLHGLAFRRGSELSPEFRAPHDIRLCTIIATDTESGPVLDGSNHLPFTWAHEAGHCLLDVSHATEDKSNPGDYPHAESQLMYGRGTTETDSVEGSKRLCDVYPMPVMFDVYDKLGNRMSMALNCVKRWRDQETATLEDW